MDKTNLLIDSLAAFNARPVAAADAPFLAALYHSTRADLDSATAAPALVQSIMGMAQRSQAADYALRFPHAHYLLLEWEGSPAARVVADIDCVRLHLVDIAVLPGARGKGIGSAALTCLQRGAAALGLPVHLSVNERNRAARRLYLALGFASVSRDETVERMCWRAHEAAQ